MKKLILEFIKGWNRAKRERAEKKIPDILIVKYIDAKREFTVQEVMIKKQKHLTMFDYNLKIMTVDCHGCTDEKHAANYGFYLLEQMRNK